MTLNTFIAVVCVVGAIMLTIAHIRFFFGEEAHKQQGELFHQPPHDEAAPVSAGDTLRTRRRDNAADLRILRKQIIVGAALTLVVVIPILIHTFAPHCPLGPLVDPWWQAVLITPVMFYSGYPVHVDGWSSLVDRRPNMNTLASIGTIAAYAYGLLICFAGDLFPAGMRMSYFAIVGIMITLVLLARLVSDLYLPQQPAFPLDRFLDRHMVRDGDRVLAARLFITALDGIIAGIQKQDLILLTRLTEFFQFDLQFLKGPAAPRVNTDSGILYVFPAGTRH